MASTLLNQAGETPKSMKSKFTQIGIVAATVGLSSVAALSQSPGNPGAQPAPGAAAQPSYSAASQAGQTEMEGRIVSLFEYLSGSADESSAPGTTTSSTTSPGATDTTRADRNAPAGSASSSTSGASGPIGAWSGTGAAAGQPLVFISQSPNTGAGSSGYRSSTTTSSSGATPPSIVSSSPNRTLPDRPGAPVAGTPGATTSPSGLGTVGMGGADAFVLVFDPNNETSRTAFSRAQWLISGRGKGADLSSTATPGATDRLNVSGREDTSRTTTDLTGRDTTTSPTSGQSLGGTPWSTHQTMAGQRVKISGRILSKGGIRALEVANIEDATPVGGASSSTDSTAPSPTSDQNRNQGRNQTPTQDNTRDDK